MLIHEKKGSFAPKELLISNIKGAIMILAYLPQKHFL